MRSLVVGGTGFLGLNLVEALKDAGHEVSITRRPSSNTIFARRLKVPMHSATLDDADALRAAMEGQEVVYFTAGHYPRYSVDTEAQVETAVADLDRALLAAREAGVSRFVYTGSVVTIGRPGGGRPAIEDDGFAEVPEGSTYFAVKLALERAALAAAEAGQDVILTCPTGIMGPYDHKVGTGFFLLGVLTGGLDFWLDGPTNIIDAADVAAASIAAAERGVAGRRYILGAHNLSVKDLLVRIADRFGVAPPCRRLDWEDAYAFAHEEEQRCLDSGRGRPAITREMVDVVVHGQFVDCARAQQELGLRPRPLEDTLDRAEAWYRKNGYLRPAARMEAS